MNYEFWNEIGNLYFMNGAYESAIHAYLHSIKLENTFGRPYSNLALAYVQTRKYREAIKLYRRSIELLSDKREKAVTWNRLGILYRQIKEYDNALEAYQRADLIMPPDDTEKLSEIRTDAKLPLTVSMPELDLDAILAKGNLPKLEAQSNNLLAEINTELEMAESGQEGSVFEEVIVSPRFENFSEPKDANFELPANMQSEWRLAYVEETLLIEEPESTKQKLGSSELKDLSTSAPVVAENEVTVDCIQTDTPSISDMEPEPSNILEANSVNEKMGFPESAAFFENSLHTESVEAITNETDMETTQYSHTEYPLSDISPEEQQLLELEIIKYQQATSKHPRSYILWEGLGEAYKSAGQYKDAIQAFQKAITMNPTNPMCHYRLGLVYAAERKEQEAIRSFKKVLELDPDSAQAHASLASQYRKMGFEQVAQEHIEKARSMQFESESDYNNACLEAICGNADRALELLEVALQSKQTYITWAQNDPDFDILRSDHRFQTLLSIHAIAT